jgi:hypothetical protein
VRPPRTRRRAAQPPWFSGKSTGPKVGCGSYLAVPLTSGGGLLSGVKLKKEDQELTLGSKVGLL